MKTTTSSPEAVLMSWCKLLDLIPVISSTCLSRLMINFSSVDNLFNEGSVQIWRVSIVSVDSIARFVVQNQNVT